MNQLFDYSRVILIGIGATMVMDLWLLILKILKVPTLNFAFLGRWVGYLFRGRFVHASIAKTPSINGEVWLGWAAHYAIGIAFATFTVIIYGLQWTQAATLLSAVLAGVFTAIFPLLIMQPAMGAGIASTKTASPILNSLKTLVNHAIFGVGLYLVTIAIAVIYPLPSFQ